MNRVNYDQTEGFPLDVNILDFGQKANQISQQLGEIIAPLAIVKGCIENGNNVGDGLVYINGELLPFKAGLKQNVVRIVESSEPRVFENGNSKPVLVTRYATFGAGAGTSYNWMDFHRPMTIKEIQKRLMPVGCIVLDYYGRIEDIPSGYVLCNGENGTPDLRDMFIVGYNPDNPDYNAIGKTGGKKEVTLTVNQMPKHKHSGSTSSDGNHYHQGLQVQGSNADNGDPGQFVNTSNSQNNGLQNNAGKTSDAGAHTHTFETNEVGENQAHENRPPFFVLAKIMYKG
ncbi:phage baseplate protein [Empedobacter falsenii]